MIILFFLWTLIIQLFKNYIKYIFNYSDWTGFIKNILIDLGNQNIIFLKLLQWTYINKDSGFFNAEIIEFINTFTNNNLEICDPSENDVDSLSKMLQQYYHEEYEGENDKDIVEMTKRIEKSISERKIYVLKNDTSEILSF